MVGGKCETEIITIFTNFSYFHHINRMNACFYVSLLDLDFCLERLKYFKVVS